MTFHQRYVDITREIKARALADALRQAATAHYTYELESVTPDAQWPDWYVEHIVRNDLLSRVA